MIETMFCPAYPLCIPNECMTKVSVTKNQGKYALGIAKKMIFSLDLCISKNETTGMAFLIFT